MSEWEQFDSAFTGISPELITSKPPGAGVVVVAVFGVVVVFSVVVVAGVGVVEVLSDKV